MTKTDSSTPHYCASCKEIIHPEARKCPSCGSFQNWRRHLGLSSSFLSVLLALISVSTVFTTVVANSGKPNNSDLKASIMNWQRILKNGSQTLAVEVLITNSGQRPGIVNGLSISPDINNDYQPLKNKIHTRRDIPSDEMRESVIVEAGTSNLFYKFYTTLLSAKDFKEKYSNVDLRIEVSNFNGKREDIIIAIRDREPEYYR